MSDTSENGVNSVRTPERRRHARQPVCTLAYVDMGEDNGGLIVDISETGFAVQTAVGLIGDRLPQLCFQLPGSENWVKAGGRLAWTGKSLKEAGIEFVDLSNEARSRIRDWISSEASGERYRVGSQTSFEERELAPGLPAIQDSKGGIPRRARSHVALEKARRDSIFSANTATAPSVGRESNRPIREPAAPDASEKRYAPSSISPINIAKSLRSHAAPVTTLWPAVPLLGPTTTSGFEANWRSAFGQRNAKEERRSWKTLATVLGLLAVISFIAGTAFGPSALNRMLGSPSATVWSEGVPSQEVAPPSANEPSTGIAEEDERRSQFPVTTPRGPFVEGAAEAASPNTPQARRSSSLQSASMAEIGETQAAPHPLLDIDTPQSASDSIAIATRRSIPTLPGVRVVTPRLKENLQVGELIQRVEPVYSPGAQQEKIEGTVKMHAVIGKDGTIRSLQLISGPPLLVPAAMGAVREWRYNPTLFEGQPIETQEDISIVFRLPR